VSYIYIYFDQEDGRIVGAEGDRKDGVGGVIYQKKKDSIKEGTKYIFSD